MVLDQYGKPIQTAVTKAVPAPYISSSGYGEGWTPVIREPFAGAWQRNIALSRESILAYHAVFACYTLISRDIAKLRVKFIEQDASGVWTETTNPAYTPVLRKPNHYQTRNQYWEVYILSKLLRGNTYALKQRDARGIVRKLYVLDPARVQPKVADDGSIFYELQNDKLSTLPSSVLVPAREIIHDRWNCIFHPLCGVSPLWAAAISIGHGLSIQENSTWFFANRSMPGGILTAPGEIKHETATRLRDQWNEQFSGRNVGKVAVLGDGLKFEKLPLVSPVDAQLIEQLKWTAEIACSVMHVPPYKIGVGAMPSYNNVQALNVEYYSQALQGHIEDAESCLDDGLQLADDVGVEFDLDGLLRMDSVTQMQVLQQGVAGSILAPNEARRKIDLKKVPGGESPMIQQQNYSLAALAKRDAKEDPFATAAAPAPAAGEAEPEEDDPEQDPPEDEDDEEETERAMAVLTRLFEQAGEMIDAEV